MMNQQKECFEFIEKAIKEPDKSKVYSVLKLIEDKANSEYWEAPMIGRQPEDSEEWALWWQNPKAHISVEFYHDDPNDIYWFFRDRAKNLSSADECTTETFPEDIIERILKIKYKRKDEEDSDE